MSRLTWHRDSQLTPHHDNTQWKKIFGIGCTGNDKIYAKYRSTNRISQNLVIHLKHKTRGHLNLYTIGWIKKGVNRVSPNNSTYSSSWSSTIAQICYVSWWYGCHPCYFREFLNFLIWIMHIRKRKILTLSLGTSKDYHSTKPIDCSTSKEEKNIMLTISHTSNIIMEDLKEENLSEEQSWLKFQQRYMAY